MRVNISSWSLSRYPPHDAADSSLDKVLFHRRVQQYVTNTYLPGGKEPTWSRPTCFEQPPPQLYQRVLKRLNEPKL